MSNDSIHREIPSPRSFGLRTLLFILAWIGALVGSLLIAQIPGDHTDSMCGVWGCYPPLQAVLAMHLFWATAIIGPIAWLATFRPCGLRSLGWILLSLGLVSIAILVSTDLSRWMATASESATRFWPRRIQYCLLTHTDYPVVQIALSGLLSLWLAPQRACRQRGHHPEADSFPLSEKRV